jgi:O-antigen/teichoic acid export membrane protein
MVLEGGLGMVLTRRLIHSPERWRETVAEATGMFAVSGAASVAVFLGLGGAWAWAAGDPEPFIACAAAGVGCAAVLAQRLCSGVLHAFERFVPDNVARLIQGSVFVGLLAVLVARGGGRAWCAVVLLAISQMAAAGYMLAVVTRDFGCLRYRLDRGRARHWLAESVPLGLGDMLRGLTRQVGTLLLWAMQTVEAVSIYSLAARPLGPLELLPRVVVQAAFPSFARQVGTHHEALRQSVATTSRLLWIISLPVAVTLCVCAEPLVVALAGPEYREAAAPLRIIAWTVPALFLSIQFRFLFTALGLSRLYMVLVVATLLLQGVLVAALIPAWGYTGACAGALVGEAAFTVGGLAAFRWLGVRAVEFRRLGAAVVAAAVMGAALSTGAHLSLFWLAPASALATAGYLALCVGLGAIPGHEVRHLRAALAGCFGRAAHEGGRPHPRESNTYVG